MTKTFAMTFRRSALNNIAAAVAFLGATALPAYAHHSEAMFASDREVSLTGTVKEFQYTNPHSYIQIVVPREGGQVQWNIETDSSLALDRAGIEPTTLQPGEKVTVRAHPLKSGRPGGSLIDVTKADGTVVSVPD